MALTGHKLGDNRFALLSPTNRAKRKKAQPKNLSEEFPELPLTKKDDPKFVIIKTTNSEKTFSSYSIFAVHKALLIICKDINKIIPNPDGSLILLLKNQTIAKKFLDTKILPGICDITVSYHENLNSVKGTVYAPFLRNASEDEIVEGLKEYNVTNVYKFQRVVQGKSQYTGVVLLTFDSYTLPDKINIAWINTSVRPYYPSPMRCKSCQKLGHTQKHCRNSPSCVSCNLPPHDPEACIRTFCANCAGQHVASSNLCPRYQQAKEIIKIKTQEKCTMRDAYKIYKSRHPIQPVTRSFANTVKSTEPTTIETELTSNISISKTNNLNQKNSTNNNSTEKTKVTETITNNNLILKTTKGNNYSSDNEKTSSSADLINGTMRTHSANSTNSDTVTDNTMEIETLPQQQTAIDISNVNTMDIEALKTQQATTPQFSGAALQSFSNSTNFTPTQPLSIEDYLKTKYPNYTTNK